MTTHPRDRHSDSEFEQDLEAVRSSWNGLEKTEPPELLDQAVLNTARRELAGQRRRRPLRWLGAFATATVVVLALTIVYQQDEQLTAPVREGADGFKLDQAAPATSRKEADRDDLAEKAGRAEAARQLKSESGERSEARMKQNAVPAAAPASDVAALAVAEESSDLPAEAELMADRISEAETWIERLLLLRETQQDEKLAEELAAFREAYPEYPLPPELD